MTTTAARPAVDSPTQEVESRGLTLTIIPGGLSDTHVHYEVSYETRNILFVYGSSADAARHALKHLNLMVRQ